MRNWWRTTSVGLLCLTACGARDFDAGLTSNDDPIACTWPDRFFDIDGSEVDCFAARYYLRCPDTSGIPVFCASNSFNECPVSGPGFGHGTPLEPCLNRCAEDEYGLECPREDSLGDTRAIVPEGCELRGGAPFMLGWCCPCEG